MGATMSDQVSFHEAGFGLIPVVKGANRDLLFEQGPCSSRRESMALLFAIRLQDAISRGWTHRKQISTRLLTQLHMSMPF